MASFKIPGATYRLQFNRTFKFSAAAALAPYLHELGITEVYASPLLQARRGSLHGYSVTNPMELNPELGTRRTFDLLARKLKARGIGLLFDIVPNHMALSHDNPWWMEVLENGPISPYAIFFDIDWHPPNRILEGRLLLPILGQPYGQALENQELKLTLESGGFFINYYEHKFPLDPKTYHQILAPGLAQLTQELGEESPVIIALTVIISLIANLPARTLLSPKKAKERQREKEIIKKNLWLLYQGTPAMKKFLDATIRRFNGTKGEAETFDSLDRLLQHQPYRLAFWRVGLELINYRRFFSINDLIGIRIEDPKVFEAFKHGLIFKLVDEGKISGLRVDHIDGLYDPLEYLQRLQACFASGDTAVPGPSQFYITVEKILAPGEKLPPEWPVAGTTGYDFLNLVNGVFVEEKGLQELQKIYARFLNDPINLTDLTLDKKKLVMNSLFGGEVENFVHYLSLLASQDWQARDISRGDLREVLVEVMASLPIYRTYIRSLEVAPRDLAYLNTTCQEVHRRSPYLNQMALNFLERVLRLDVPAYLGSDQKAEWLNFVMRWQQFTGPIMAKGWEDTVLYIYNPLISLNEVGGSFRSIPAGNFHQLNQQRQKSSPLTMNATSTHDTKRSEDVRARLNVLSEIPEDWEEHLKRWGNLNRSKKVEVNGVLAPDQNQEILLYQTMLGTWPLDPAEVPAFKLRIQGYMIKAAREAMVHTRWISPQVEHEKALLAFVDRILDEAGGREFLADFRTLQSRLAYYGAMNSLSQVVLKIAAPGVPDFYQGTELWDFSLVDPDNRRPVDFAKRVRFLKDLKLQERKKGQALVYELISRWADGRIKLYVTYKALNFRRDNPDLFLQGDYFPLAVEGGREKNILALARRQGPNWVLAVTARFLTKIAQPGQLAIGREVWGESVLRLPPEAPVRWIDILTEAEHCATESGPSLTLPLWRIFQHLPVAFLSNSI
jgi:(1->4)-alpha-D-glucan 1-alpha-D-glucosylmutase